MRVAALGLHHETNTFSSFPTTYETFSTSSYGGIWRDSEIEQHQRASHSTFAGYFQAADEFGFDLVPLLFAVNDPSGTITRDAFDRVVDEMMRDDLVVPAMRRSPDTQCRLDLRIQPLLGRHPAFQDREIDPPKSRCTLQRREVIEWDARPATAHRY